MNDNRGRTTSANLPMNTVRRMSTIRPTSIIRLTSAVRLKSKCRLNGLKIRADPFYYNFIGWKLPKMLLYRCLASMMTPGTALTRTLTSVAMTPAPGMVAALRTAEVQEHALS